MIQELYINGILADIDESLSLTLQYKSFLFVGISDIQANRSWNVSLKKTATNLGIIEQSHTSDSDSIFPYRNFVVDYYIDGFRIIDTGKAILLRVSDKLEFVFMFGTAFDKIKTLSDKKLNELTENVGDGIPINEGGTGDWLNWNRNVKKNQNPMQKGVAYVDLYTFTNKDNSYPLGSDPKDDLPSTLHPSVTFDWILGKIEEEYSEIDNPFDFTDLRTLVYNKNWGTILKGIDNTTNSLLRTNYFNYINPTLFNNSSTQDMVGAIFGYTSPTTSDYWYYRENNSLSIGSFSDLGVAKTVTPMSQDNYFEAKDSDFTIELQIKNLHSKKKLDLYIEKRQPWVNFATNYFKQQELEYTLGSGSFPYIYNTTVYFDFNSESHRTMALLFHNLEKVPTSSSWYQIQAGQVQDDIIIFRFIPKKAFYNRSLTKYGFYPIVPNLPQLSCSDFIYQCMQMLGVFPYLKEGEPNKIYFRSAKALYDNLTSQILQDVTTTQTEVFTLIADDTKTGTLVGTEPAEIISSIVFIEITATQDGTFSIPCINYANTLEGSEKLPNEIFLYSGHSVDFGTATPIQQYTFTDIYSTRELDIPSSGDYTIKLNTAVYFDGAIGDYTIKSQLGFDEQINEWQITKTEPTLVANPKSFKDWSDKLIKTTETESELEHVEFTFGKYAKKNILDYKVNETNPIDSSDYIEVDNYNLEDKQDLVRLQLAAPQVEKLDSRMIAYWLYDVKLASGVLTTEYTGGSNNDIVCKLQKNALNDNWDAIFPTDMQFNGTGGLKAQYYTDYQKLVRKPRFIKERFRVQPYDLQSYDPEIPIYLAQYGKYYAVMTMQVGNNLIAECELLELKEI